LETLIAKETLQSKLSIGVGPAIDFLYDNYSAMLYGYVLQFIPDRQEAEKMLVLIFGDLSARLPEACTSPLSVYCWMQVEARKVILAYRQASVNGQATSSGDTYYLTLLQHASDQQKRVFSELFLKGRDKEELAGEMQITVQDINRLLKESLLVMRNNLPEQ